MTNTTLRHRKRDFQKRLTKTACSQIDQWLLEGKLTYLRIIAMVAEQFHFTLSASTLSRRNAELITQMANQEREAALKAAHDPTPKAPVEILAKMEKRAVERLDDPDTEWTPGRILQLQRIVLEPWRRQITENRERRADRIAQTNAQYKQDTLAWQKQYAQIKLTTPKGQLPDESLFETPHPLNQIIEEELICDDSEHTASPEHGVPPSGGTAQSTPEPCPNSETSAPSFTNLQSAICNSPAPAPSISNLKPQISNPPKDLCLHEPLCPPEFPCEHRSEEYQRRLATQRKLHEAQQPTHPDFASTYGEEKARLIRRALRGNPFWKVPMTPEQLHAACSTYVQLRDDEKISRRANSTKYKHCPCGGPAPCPLHGEYPEIFWRQGPRCDEFVMIMIEKGFTWNWPRNTGIYLLVDPDAEPEQPPMLNRNC